MEVQRARLFYIDILVFYLRTSQQAEFLSLLQEPLLSIDGQDVNGFTALHGTC
jgi:hypothetical protein